MSPELQNLFVASIMTVASVLSGFGAGFLFISAAGAHTKIRRLCAMLFGVFAGLSMLNAMIWLGYHGFKYVP